MENSITLLIVEDDRPSAILLSQMLGKSGYRCLEPVESGELAITAAAEQRPDLVLMDITLAGGIDGIEAASRIYQQFSIPTVFITASTDDTTMQRAMKANPYGYVLKPYDKNMLHATIELALFKRSTEQKLSESEKRNRATLAAVPDPLFNLNLDGSFASPLDEEVARKRGVWPDAVARKACEVIGRARGGGEIQTFEYALKKSEALVYYEARIIRSGPAQVLVVVRDVSAKKKAEAALKNYQKNLEEQVAQRTHEITESNRNLESQIALRKQMEENLKIFSHAIEQNPLMVAIINKDGIVEYVNDAYCTVSGYERDAVIGTSLNAPGNPLLAEPEMWQNFTGRSRWKGELYNLRTDGSLYYLRAHVTSITGDDGQVSHYVLSAEDITEQKRQQMVLDQAKESLEAAVATATDKELDWKEWKEKMMERNISRTDKSLFRNINNSFTQGAGFGALISLIDLMESTSRETDGGKVIDESIFKHIKNNVNIVKEAFKTFSSIDWIIANEFELKRTPLRELYNDTKAIISKLGEFAVFNENRLIINDFNPLFNTLNTNINREYLLRAIYEIIINALKFSKRKSFVVVYFNMVNKNVVISVVNDPEKSDEGFTGIPLEYEKVVFEPFYRLTKIVYEKYNTLDFGLGLTLVEKIVSKHGGEVIARNIMDHSDTRREAQIKVNVSISLPLAEEKGNS